MAEVIITEIDVDGLTARSLCVLKAAVKFAEVQKYRRVHSIAVEEFCDLAGLPNLAFDDMRALLNEARRAIASIEIVDTMRPNQENFISWAVFDEIVLVRQRISFRICHLTWNDRLLSILQSLSPACERVRNSVIDD